MVVTIEGVVARLQAMPRGSAADGFAHNKVFKWEYEKAGTVVVRDSIFYLEEVPEGDPGNLPFPGGVYENVTVVLGPGFDGDGDGDVTELDYPVALPTGVSQSRDVSIFTTAREAWLAAHGYLTAPSVDEIHYTFTGPTSVSFDWRGQSGTFRYGLTDQYGTELAGQTPSPLPFSSLGPFWEASLTGLQPGTTYHYSIGGGPDRTFTTAPSGGCRFDAEGDIGSSLNQHAVGSIQALIAADDPDFVLAVGDLTYADVTTLQAVDQHFNDVMAWSRTGAYMPAWGNHEWDAPANDDLRNYMGRFAIPNGRQSIGTPTPAGEDWGWFDACGVRFISYPEPYTSATWTEWQAQAAAIMAAAQADPSIRFIVTFGHRPAYSTGKQAGESALAVILDGFGQTYSKYALNLNGHSHDYERFQPIDGVIHITTGGGGKSVSSWRSTDPRTAFRALHFHHLRVDVTATAMQIAAICGPATSSDDIACTMGSVFDQVTITADRNSSPTVSAGPDQTVALSNPVALDGTVTDDGRPSSGTLSTTWSVVSGPGSVSFADAGAVDTSATFSDPGTYVLRLTATDTELSASDEVTVTAVAGGVPVTIQVPVAAGSDDAEESLSGSVNLSSSDLELVTDGTTVQIVGVRFDGVGVLTGSTIVSASVQFQVDEASTDVATLSVAGQAADDAATFAGTSRDISSRARTAATVPWTVPTWPTVGVSGPDQRTPDLAAVIQEIVDRPGWSAGNALAIIIAGSGRRTAEAVEGTGAPILHITYVPP
jgi:hypothetical protein